MPLGPLAALRFALAADLAPGAEDGLGDLERRMVPTELGAGSGDLVLAERRAVRGSRAGLGRRAETDDGLAGDQRPTFQLYRRVKSSNSAGTMYGSISSATYALGVTTIVLLNDTGDALDSGLNSVSYGFIGFGSHVFYCYLC